MEIIAYQAFIFATILFVRFVAPAYLLAACIIWTVLTIVNLFFPPLIFLQLVTVWGGYALLRPSLKSDNASVEDVATKGEQISSEKPVRQRKPAAKARADLQPAGENRSVPSRAAPTTDLPRENAAAENAAATGELRTKQPAATLPQPVAETHKAVAQSNSGSIFGGIGRTLDQLNERLSTLKAIQEATSEIEIRFYREKVVIESVYKQAVQKVERDKELAAMSPELRALYEENKARMDDLLGSLRARYEKDLRLKDLGPVLAPDFSQPITHPDTAIREKIAQKIQHLKQEREDFLQEYRRNFKYCFGNSILISDKIRKSGKNGPLVADLLFPISHCLECDGLSGLEMLNKYVSKARARSGTSEQFVAIEGGIGGQDIRTNVSSRDEELKQFAEERCIPYLVHFTRIENLPSICEHGLLPVASLSEKSLRYVANDHYRYDNRKDATSLSIGHINDRMFYKYRRENPTQDWAVLLLDPAIIWTSNVAFCKHNAADNRISKRPLAELQTLSAFEGMFEEVAGDLTGRSSALRSYDPTDVQAEILVFGAIRSALIAEIVVSDPDLLYAYRDCIDGRRASVHTEGSGLFGSREFARKARLFH